MRKLGIVLTQLPGEYRGNFHNGDGTACLVEDIEQALAAGRALAAAAPAPVVRRGPLHARMLRQQREES